MKIRFAAIGIHVLRHECYGTAFATASYIKEELKLPEHRLVYLIGGPGLEQALYNLNIMYLGRGTSDDNYFPTVGDVRQMRTNPAVAAVVCANDMRLNPLKIARASQFLSANSDCLLIIPDEKFTVPREHFQRSFSSASSSQLSDLRKLVPKSRVVCIGKPHRAMFECIKRKNPHLDPSRTLMIGDRIETDVRFGINHGIDTLLVLTGMAAPSQVGAIPADQAPTYVVPSLGEFHKAFHLFPNVKETTSRHHSMRNFIEVKITPAA